MIDIDTERVAFERWITAPPFEMGVTRYPPGDERAWPGQYCDISVEIAWEAWQERAAMVDDEVRRDAERYRWLRDNGINYYQTGVMPDLIWQGPDWLDINGPDFLDSRIDAAMADGEEVGRV
jgi:hypothetical protein